MLEWYRAFSNLDAIAQDLQELLSFLNDQMKSLATAPQIRVVTVAELVSQYVNFDLKPSTDESDLRGLCRQLDIPFGASDTWDELFFRVFLERIEMQLPPEPLLVRYYPPRLAAYSRVLDSGWADRFELYWKGFEIANAFHELNDPRVQRQRMEKDNERKLALGLQPVALDEEFLACLERGLPPSGGIALGVERLFMAFMDLQEIGTVRG
jgi:lysyl-tRNA synthetase class 2